MSQLAAGDGSHVIDIDFDDSAEPTHQLAAAANHVIDVNVGRTASRRPETHECAVCMERLRWVAVGPCGHLEVCSKCALRIRSVDGNRLCCICRTPCPAVLVTGRSRAGDGKHVYTKVSSLAAAEGRVGNYWYHKASAAYFDDGRQYNAAKRACSELEQAKAVDEDENDRPAGSTVLIFVVYVAIHFVGGSIMCSSYVAAYHHWSLQLAMLLGSGSGFAAMAITLWFLLVRLHQRGRH